MRGGHGLDRLGAHERGHVRGFADGAQPARMRCERAGAAPRSSRLSAEPADFIELPDRMCLGDAASAGFDFAAGTDAERPASLAPCRRHTREKVGEPPSHGWPSRCNVASLSTGDGHLVLRRLRSRRRRRTLRFLRRHAAGTATGPGSSVAARALPLAIWQTTSVVLGGQRWWGFCFVPGACLPCYLPLPIHRMVLIPRRTQSPRPASPLTCTPL